jgi:hypothetical protein
MSNTNCRCGIYSIATPNGSTYIGSSNKIERRWHEHRSLLRHGKHHSTRLQAAWDKHGAALVFSVLMECPLAELNEREHEFIDRLGAKLNTSTFVENVWLNESTRAKFSAIHQSPEWKESRRRIATESSTRWVAVECSNGTQYKNMTDAARAFGVRAAGIAHLVRSQRVGRLGVRFKLQTECWRDVPTWQDQRVITMRQNGNDKRTDQSRARMSAAKKGRAVSPQCLAAATAANRKTA